MKPIIAPIYCTGVDMALEYWNGTRWRKMNHEYLGESSKELIRVGMDRTTSCDCHLLGYNICRCASISPWNKESFSRPVGQNIYSLHTPSQNLGHSGYAHMFTGRKFGFNSQATVPLEAIVDKWLLRPGDIEIEASL